MSNKKQLLKQYNGVADTYSAQIQAMNKKSIKEFQEALASVNVSGKKVLDLGCGAGDLISYLQSIGYDYAGVDSSEGMISKIQKTQNVDLRVEDFTKTSFKNSSFDLVVSKWAVQTVQNIELVYKEAYRLLKRDACLVFLVSHPVRQFLEKKKAGKNYFTKEIVNSLIFNKSITVQEPSHTMAEYLSDYFLDKFHLLKIIESYEFPGAEQINGDIYPTHLLFIAQKK